ncbi:MAG TPA: hypothetical protein EYP92_04235 [Candidatus Thioglobus sp.]|jgi:hypothetical protein|nr:hypothetical protein [Candidatus Thioglobus sp.]HIL43042.1 hypothetical protein [Gammaproteobacteria bacterium]
MTDRNRLLFFVDEGGFDDFTPLFVEIGYIVDFVDSQRKAIQLAKKNQYRAVVAEFNYNPEFRDRVSNIESLLATLESHSVDPNIIILYDKINLIQFEQLKKRFRINHSLNFPINKKELTLCFS